MESTRKSVLDTIIFSNIAGLFLFTFQHVFKSVVRIYIGRITFVNNFNLFKKRTLSFIIIGIKFVIILLKVYNTVHQFVKKFFFLETQLQTAIFRKQLDEFKKSGRRLKDQTYYFFMSCQIFFSFFNSISNDRKIFYFYEFLNFNQSNVTF